MKPTMLTAGILAMLAAGAALSAPALAASPKADSRPAVTTQGAAPAATPVAAKEELTIEQFRAQQKEQRDKLKQLQKDERDKLKAVHTEQRQKLKAEQHEQYLAFRQQRADAGAAAPADKGTSRFSAH